MERMIETLLLGLRWTLLPLYLALLVSQAAIYVMVARELWHLGAHIMGVTDIDVVLLLCSVLDLVLLANLLAMVAVSSYESFISRIQTPPGANTPEWLGKLDSGGVKVKVAVAVSMISMIHLLRAFMSNAPGDELMLLAGVHAVFVLSAIGVAFVDRASRAAH